MTYATEWGPRKPADSATSLRGIRLICTLAGWLSKVLDQWARQTWQACPEQFGFRQGVGCLEAVVVLIALIRSRTCDDNRLYVLFVDLRTAFPSLNRPILLRRVFECGLSLLFCRLLLAIFDSTLSLCVSAAWSAKAFERSSASAKDLLRDHTNSPCIPTASKSDLNQSIRVCVQ